MLNFEPGITEDVIRWIADFAKNTGTDGFVLGVSGGKDSAVVAGLLTKAVGPDKVLGVLMPNGEQKDISDSLLICDFLKIPKKIINIKNAFDGLTNEIGYISDQTKTNIPPRIRMITLYTIAQNMNRLVCGTGNASEAYIGYCTKWGDAANDLNPIACFTTQQVVAIGEYLGLPKNIIHKAPSDGLCGKTDEENIGFTYAQLNQYINTGVCENLEIKAKIDKMHAASRHKFSLISTFPCDKFVKK